MPRSWYFAISICRQPDNTYLFQREQSIFQSNYVFLCYVFKKYLIAKILYSNWKAFHTVTKWENTFINCTLVKTFAPVDMACPKACTIGISNLSWIRILIPAALWGPGIYSYCSTFSFNFNPFSTPETNVLDFEIYIVMGQ